MHPPLSPSAGHFVLLCPKCRLPVPHTGQRSTPSAPRCACLPQAFACIGCGAVVPFEASKRRKLTREGRWTWIRSYTCARCRTNEEQRRHYKRNLASAAAREHAHASATWRHPLTPWVRFVRNHISNFIYKMPLVKDASMRLYLTEFIRILRDYAQALETIIRTKEDYDPLETKPTMPLLRGYLPRRDRVLLHEMCVNLGLDRHRKVWAKVNARFRKEA